MGVPGQVIGMLLLIVLQTRVEWHTVRLAVGRGFYFTENFTTDTRQSLIFEWAPVLNFRLVLLSCGAGLLTVCFDLPIVPFDNLAQLRPTGEIFEVESDIVRLSEIVQVAGVELEEVHRRHGTNGGHLVCDLESRVPKILSV